MVTIESLLDTTMQLLGEMKEAAGENEQALYQTVSTLKSTSSHIDATRLGPVQMIQQDHSGMLHDVVQQVEAIEAGLVKTELDRIIVTTARMG